MRDFITRRNNTLVTVILILCSCCMLAENSDKDIITITPQYTSQELDSIKKRFVEKGDHNAYVTYFGYRGDDQELLYSFYMANKYNDSGAQYDIYQKLTSFHNDLGVEIDSATNALAISYLKRSIEQNYSSALYEMSMLLLYGIGVQQDTAAAKEYIYKRFDKPKADKIWFIKKRQYEESLNIQKSNKGDENFFITYFGRRNDDQELLYSFFMANKYNSAVAQYHVYEMLTSFYNKLGMKIDPETNALAISFLQKSVDQNDSYAQFEMSRLLLYGIGIPQDTIAAKEYIYKAFEKKDADRVWRIRKRQYEESLKKAKK